MAQVKISELPSASSLTGSEVLPIVQGGSTLTATVNQIKDKVQASTINVLKMNASSVQTLANIGELAFNPDTQTLEVKCSSDVTISIGQENYIRGKNDESSTILNGTVVYVSGGKGANSLIKRAGNADGTAERVIGVATQDIGANNIGFITTSGIVNKLNTSAYAEGTLLWLGTNGAMTNVKPDTSVDQICIGVVLRSHATEGSILVAVKDDWRDKLAEVRSDLKLFDDELVQVRLELEQEIGKEIIGEHKEIFVNAENETDYFPLSEKTPVGYTIKNNSETNFYLKVLADDTSYKTLIVGSEFVADKEYAFAKVLKRGEWHLDAYSPDYHEGKSLKERVMQLETDSEDAHEEIDAIKDSLSSIEDLLPEEKELVSVGVFSNVYVNAVGSGLSSWGTTSSKRAIKVFDIPVDCESIHAVIPKTPNTYGFVWFWVIDTTSRKVFIPENKVAGNESQMEIDIAVDKKYKQVGIGYTFETSSEDSQPILTYKTSQIESEISSVKSDIEELRQRPSIDDYKKAFSSLIKGEARSGNRKLKVLGVGNSWTMNSMQYLGDILSNLGYDVDLHRTMAGSASLQMYANNLDSNTESFEHLRLKNGAFVSLGMKNIKNILQSEMFDIVVFQQESSTSGLYESFQPYLNKLVDWVNANVAIVPDIYFHSTWAYPNGSDHSGFDAYGNDNVTMYNSIISAGNSVVDDAGIVHIIPNAPNIQQAKDIVGLDMTTFWQQSPYFGYHLNNNGCYSASCLWAETIIKKFYGSLGKGIVDCDFKPNGLADEIASAMRNIAHNVVANITQYYTNAE